MTVYILTTTQTTKRQINKLGHFVTTNQAEIPLKAAELGLTQYKTETYEAQAYESNGVTYFQVYGISDATEGQVFESGFLISQTENPEAVIKEQAKAYALGLNFQLLIATKPFPSIKLKDEIVNHPFIQTAFEGWGNTFYDFDEAGYKAVLPTSIEKLTEYVTNAKTQEQIDALISEMSIYAQQVSLMVEQFRAKQLLESPELTETEFLDNPENQALITNVLTLEPTSFPLINAMNTVPAPVTP